MVYILIALIITIIVVLLASQGTIDETVLIWGVFMFLGSFIGITVLGESIGYSDPEYRNVNSSYDIKEIQASKYYTISSNGDSVSVLIDKGSDFEKETFPEDVVNFVETNDSAKVTMDMKVFRKPSKTDKVLFWKESEPNEEFPEKIYESVTIYIPKGSETINQTPEVNANEKQSVEPQNAYCSECGAKIGDKAKFCSGCGSKVK
ncbi:MAG: zinc ribbon domain-containing protein [Lachnospiraceae bacterium]|nr:zinc ribbon domain-containing protein [Lachnospiraceae bacterium]